MLHGSLKAMDSGGEGFDTQAVVLMSGFTTPRALAVFAEEFIRQFRQRRFVWIGIELTNDVCPNSYILH